MGGVAVAPKAASYYDLNQLAERMRREPGTTVEIRVLTDTSPARGTPRPSPLRAEYLKAFLVATGIDPSRVAATGVVGPAGLSPSGEPLKARVDVVVAEPVPAP